MESKSTYILAHDIGTTGNKSCLYRLGGQIELVDSALVEYPLYTLPDGSVEQKVDEWWGAVCQATRAVMGRSGIAPGEIEGMAFCAQMQGFIPVSEDGEALRNPMSYMDSRATAQIQRGLYHGFPRISGWNAYKTLRSLQVTGGLSATAKDPLWKYHWVRDNEPGVFGEMRYWLDVKDYLAMRCTGEASMGYDSAHATFLFNARPGKLDWHEGLCRMFEVDMGHLPPVKGATDVIGRLTAQAAGELGLVEGIPVFGGGGDLSMISVGAGCFDLYDTHIYIGTSGWVVSSVDRLMTDIDGLIASILGATPGWYNYISEQETSGRCLQWVRDHLALDEIGVYLEDHPYSDEVEKYESLYAYLSHEIEKSPPGSNGVIFTPWLHGNRSPFEDPYARGMFFNLGLETSKRDLVRAVIEGDVYQKLWMLETVEKKVPRQERLRFVGGGAQSRAWGQILADVTGREIEVIENAQNAGTIGAALVCAVGLGKLKSFQEARPLIGVSHTYSPNPAYGAIYDRNFEVFKELHKNNRRAFRRLNRERL